MSPRPSRVRQPSRELVALLTTPLDEAGTPQNKVLWSPPGGLVRNKRVSQLTPAESPQMHNLRIKDGAYQVRPGVIRLGNALPDPILHAAVFVTSENTELVHALTTTGIYELVGDSWVQLDGPVLTAQEYAHYALTAWNNKLIYTNGFDKIGEVDNVSRSYAPIPAAPRARHITTFAGRLVAGYVEGIPNRLQWTARNNNADWTGLGSGFEDLLSTPGGVVDAVRGIFPLSDTDALVVRSRSVWLMRETGYVQSPFSFSKLWDISGTIAPWTLALTPIGLFGLFRDNVYLMTAASTPEPIGFEVREEILSNANIDFASAAYDVWNREYCIALPGEDLSTVWRYSVDTKKWTKDIYHFPIHRMQGTLYRNAIAIEDLEGTMDDLEGPFELLGLLPQEAGLLFSSGVADQTVVRESAGATDDEHPWDEEGNSPIGFEIQSSQMVLTTVLRTIHMTEFSFEYTASRPVNVRLYVSSDGGVTWTFGGYLTVPASQAAEIGRIAYQASRGKLMAKLLSLDGAGLSLHAGYPRLAEGGEIAY
jgi:hypothetical protein